MIDRPCACCEGRGCAACDGTGRAGLAYWTPSAVQRELLRARLRENRERRLTDEQDADRGRT